MNNKIMLELAKAINTLNARIEAVESDYVFGKALIAKALESKVKSKKSLDKRRPSV